MSTAAIADMVTGPGRQYALLYRYCQVSSMSPARCPTSSGARRSQVAGPTELPALERRVAAAGGPGLARRFVNEVVAHLGAS